MGRQISSICRGLLRQITGSDVNGQRSTKGKCKKQKVKIRLNFNTYTNTMQYLHRIFIYNHFTKKQIFTILFGIRHFIVFKMAMTFFLQKFAFLMASARWSSCGATRNGVVGKFWQKGDQWLYCFDTPPHSADIFVKYFCITARHLHIHPIYLSRNVVSLLIEQGWM